MAEKKQKNSNTDKTAWDTGAGEKEITYQDLQKLLSVYETFISMSDDLFCVLDQDGNIHYASKNSYKILGFKSEELINNSISNIVPKEFHTTLFSLIADDGKKLPQDFELPLKTKSGQLFTSEILTEVLSLEDQTFFAFRIKDTTLLKRSEIEISMLSHALKNASDCISVFDLTGNIIFVNEVFCETYEYTKNELLGQNISRFHVQNNTGSCFDDIIKESISGSWEGELQAKRKNNKRFNLALRTSVVNGEDGAPLVIIGVGHDITEMKLMEEQLRQSQKMEAIGQLAGGIAHDFNNLLTVIEGYVELLMSSIMSSDPTHNFVQQIKRATDRASSLTGQLLAFSRSQILQPKNIDLNDLIENMSALLHRLISEDIELVFNLSSEIKSIKADHNQIEQILMNMAVNARDAMPGGGILSIETNDVYLDGQYIRSHSGVKKGRYVMLSISDNGKGMDTETQSRIFEPFYTTKEKSKGTGLGLSTVYGIVKQSEGHIWVYSEPGLGTAFKIYLPAFQEEVHEETDNQQEPDKLGGDETILVVEDEYLVRELVCDTLQNSGYKIIEASNGKEAVELYQSNNNRIDLVLTDVIMPEMSGRKLVETLIEQYPDLKSLYMSGYTDDAIIRHGVLEPGMNYIQKPFSPRALLAKINEVLA